MYQSLFFQKKGEICIKYDLYFTISLTACSCTVLCNVCFQNIMLLLLKISPKFKNKVANTKLYFCYENSMVNFGNLFISPLLYIMSAFSLAFSPCSSSTLFSFSFNLQKIKGLTILTQGYHTNTFKL